MKYLIVLFVIMVAIFIWRSNRREERKERDAARRNPPQAPRAGPPAPPQEMVSCSVCAVHLPRADALTGRQGIYCSAEHRNRIEA